MNNLRTRSRLLVVAVIAAGAVAGCGANGGAQHGARPATLAQLNSCLGNAGAKKAANASDLSFAAADIARLNYATAGSKRVAGTQVYEMLSTYHPGYALFMVAKPGSAQQPSIASAVDDPASVAGMYFIRGDNPDFQAAQACMGAGS